LRTVLRIIYWILALVVVAIGGTTWWLVYRPLPKIDGSQQLPGLRQEVRIERDRWGVPHIRAGSIEDLARAQGYVMAQDRLWQMDLLRRVARGQLSEILGDRTLKFDRQFRTLGFAQAADRDYSLLDSETKTIVDAYADGVNAFIHQHDLALPLEFTLLHYKPQPWQPTDTFVISGYMYQTLTSTWERKIDRAVVTARVGADRAKDLFSQDSDLDHVVIGDPDVANDGSKGAKLASGDGDDDDDDDDDDDMQPDTVFKARLQNGSGTRDDTPADLTSALANDVLDFLAHSQAEIRQGLGSNNWVVSGAHTATGKPLLANDTHLELSIPPIWYEVHLTAPGWNVKGFTLPGAPMVVIGHNDKIAWGFTNNGADVQDLYIETFNPANPDEYLVKGAWTKALTRDEVIRVKGQPDQHLKVVLTRHGPIVRMDDAAHKGYAMRWTATEPGGLSNTYNWLGHAKNWDEFRNTMRKVWGPGQNAVYADTRGNIGYIMAARVPIRKKGHGEVPVPGDTDDYEWTGYIPFDELPQAINPDSGLIVTANARVVGEDYKPYLTDRWEEPYRTARIYELLHDRRDLRPEDMLKVQTDTFTYPEAFLAEQLLASTRAAQPKDDRARKLIQGLKDWNGIADANSPEVSFLYTVRHTALELMLEPYLGNDLHDYTWRRVNFLQEVLTDRPAKWLPGAYKNYDELLAAAADRAVADLQDVSHSPRIEDWPWKRFDSLEMLHPIGREGLLKTLLSISGKPQNGTSLSVRAAGETHGPAMRFVANPANWDESIMLIPAGQSGQLGSSHYTDQFDYWYEGKPIFAPFSDAAESNGRRHTLTLKP
jgi:penicillin G amidase